MASSLPASVDSCPFVRGILADADSLRRYRLPPWVAYCFTEPGQAQNLKDRVAAVVGPSSFQFDNKLGGADVFDAVQEAILARLAA